ncbi:hypothetical protein GE061_012586 [Apolygus lucorum]|uniref:Uncharacterized protein n=1 Tax=Apolygus lucorum TaxID=248454 RepID=A0A8S9XV05_APOLU|nr:hypothetical protein GE061_012586 [Apolygus lucorum]
MLVGNIFVRKEAHGISNKTHEAQGGKRLPYESTNEESRSSYKEGDLSKIENMLNKLGENVCNRFTRYSGCDGCRSCGGYDGDCSNWTKEKQKNHDDGKLEDYFNILRKEIGDLRAEIASCCQASKVANPSKVRLMEIQFSLPAQVVKPERVWGLDLTPEQVSVQFYRRKFVSLNMWSSCWLLIVMLVGNIFVRKEAHGISNKTHEAQGGKRLPYESINEESRSSYKEGDLSKIENMLNKLGENVCNRFTRYSGCDGCRSCGGYDGDCSNWMKGKQKNHDDGKLEDYFNILRKEIGDLRAEIASCCQASKVANPSDDVTKPLKTIISNQQGIIEQLRKLLENKQKTVKQAAAIYKKRTKEWEDFRASLEHEVSTLKIDFKKQLKKSKLCPTYEPIRRNVLCVGEIDERFQDR